jgi:hypothetical protein
MTQLLAASGREGCSRVNEGKELLRVVDSNGVVPKIIAFPDREKDHRRHR